MNCKGCGQSIHEATTICPFCGTHDPGGGPSRAVRYTSRTSSDGSGKAVASLVLGLVGLVAWCIPLVGIPVTAIAAC